MGNERSLQTSEIPSYDEMVERYAAKYAMAIADDLVYERGITWYPRSNADLHTLQSELIYDYSIDLTVHALAGVTSIVSPGRYWQLNVKDAKFTVLAYFHSTDRESRVGILRSGKVGTRYGLPAFMRAWGFLAGTYILRPTAPKTYAFADNLEFPLTSLLTTVDQHIVHIALADNTLGSIGVSKSQYPRFVRPIEYLASIYGLLPSQFQAVLWEQRQAELAQR